MRKTLKRLALLAFAGMLTLCIAVPSGKASAASASSVYLPDGKYYLQKYHGLYLHTYNGNVDIGYSSDWKNSEFYLERGKDGFYTIRNVWSAKNLDVAGASSRAGTNVGLWWPNNSCAQKWALDYNGNGYYSFRNACGNMTLDLAGGVNESGTNVQTWYGNGTEAQRWRIIESERSVGNSLENQDWTLASRVGVGYENHYNLDVSGNRTNNGTNLQIWPRNYTSAQTFRIISNADGSVRIKLARADKSVDVAWADRHNGANVHLWDSNDTCAQRWFVEENGFHGTYRFLNACSGRALDVSGGVTGAGVNVQIWDATIDNDAQEWYPIKL